MALVLTRRKGDKIRIGDDVVITIHEVRDKAVRVGIDAPRDVPILREEVYQRIDRTEGEQ